MNPPSVRVRKTLLASAVCLALGLGTIGSVGAGMPAAADPEGVGTETGADPDEETNDGMPGDPLGSEGFAGRNATVTLITGDRAVVTFAEDGAPSAQLQTQESYISRREGDALYLIPKSAQPAIDSGSVDVELFNVAGLVRAGYDDASRDDVPLIIEGAVPKAKGVGRQLPLESIGATATTVDKDRAANFWTQSAQTRRAGGKIWLDAHVTGFDLDPETGVGQTGAPQVWADGYQGKGTTVAVLDSGAAVEHVDLASRIAKTRDFSGEGADAEDVSDFDGHGTHVASTIAGTGAASDGDRRGMAPKSRLLIGKVLGYGGGQASWIIAGMEWAVAQDADVVNMSLGTNQPTDCTDPIARAANRLSKQDKSLFVVAAGNAGATETVSSPGCAAGVLTVGAVDSESEVANFSSRGPGYVTHAVKPDITAPGVGIVGANADSYGDIPYTKMSGTSMAAPHVAGAAALLRDAHPKWSAQRLRQALTSGVKTDADGTVYESGVGELSVPKALNGKVVGTSSLLLGNFAWPHNGHERATRSLRFTNTTKKPITLRFKVTDLQGFDGASLPRGALRLGTSRAKVAPGRTIKVPVTARDLSVGLSKASYGGIGARVVATNERGSVLATSSVGYWLEPKSADLTVNLLDRDGQPVTWGSLTIFQLDDSSAQAPAVAGEPITTRLRTGRISIDALVETESTGEWSYLSFPEYDLKGRRTITLDARKAVPVQVEVGQETDARSASVHYARTTDDDWLLANAAYPQQRQVGDAAVSVLPTTGAVTNGEMQFSTSWRLYQPGVPTAESDFVYNLAFEEQGGVAADQQHTVIDAGLASVEETWGSQGGPQTFLDSMQTRDSLTGGYLFVGPGGDPVGVPGTRIAWYQSDRPWRQLATSRRIFTEMFYGHEESFSAGDQEAVDWYKLPSATSLYRNPDGSAARVAERQANLMGFGFAHWKDAAGHYGEPGFGDVGNVELFRDGESLGISAWPAGQWEVPAENASYDVVLRQLSFNSPSWWKLGPETWTKFSFDSGRPGGEDVDALPVMVPRYDAEVNDLQQAPAQADYPVSVTFEGQDGYDPGQVGEVTAQVSFDDYTLGPDETPAERFSWVDVPVEQQGDDWVIKVDNTQAAGKFVSVHVTGTATDGSKVDQYAMNVYGVE